VAIAGVAGCSSSPANSAQPPGSVPFNTAQVSVNGQNTGTTHDVLCTQDGWTHTIYTGDKASAKAEDRGTASGVSVVVNTGDNVFAPSVQIVNVSGFTGSVWENYNEETKEITYKIGKAQATVIGSTFKITGTAQGENTNDPNKNTTATFEVKANC
jgi:lipoprotein LpqH